MQDEVLAQLLNKKYGKENATHKGYVENDKATTAGKYQLTQFLIERHGEKYAISKGYIQSTKFGHILTQEGVEDLIFLLQEESLKIKELDIINQKLYKTANLLHEINKDIETTSEGLTGISSLNIFRSFDNKLNDFQEEIREDNKLIVELLLEITEKLDIDTEKYGSRLDKYFKK